jgi:hypothetical protein
MVCEFFLEGIYRKQQTNNILIDTLFQ